MSKQQPREVGVFETKTHLSGLIDRVEEGQAFYITRRGKRVALLQPAERLKPPLTRGCAKNKQYRMADDFDETPAEFRDYT